MKIKIHGLRKGINEFSLMGDPSELNLPEQMFKHPVEIWLSLEDVGDLINAEYRFTTLTEQICDRCAREFELPLNVRGRMYFIPDSGHDAPEQDGVKYFHPYHPEVDVAQDVFDGLMLALPAQILCRQDCRGLCQKCGADLNLGDCGCGAEKTDPRWTALKDSLPSG